jgi:hypothetical protein
MPFRIEGDRVVLEGHCPVDEAPDLFQALLEIEGPVFALEGAQSLHTAVVQLLIASRGRLTRRPEEPALAACLASLQDLN